MALAPYQGAILLKRQIPKIKVLKNRKVYKKSVFKNAWTQRTDRVIQRFSIV